MLSATVVVTQVPLVNIHNDFKRVCDIHIYDIVINRKCNKIDLLDTARFFFMYRNLAFFVLQFAISLIYILISDNLKQLQF